LVAAAGLTSVVTRGPLVLSEKVSRAGGPAGVPVDAVQTPVAPSELAGGSVAVAVTRVDRDAQP